VSWDFDNPPPGYRAEWAPDTHWTTDPAVTTGNGCRFTVGPGRKVCGQPAVAALNRRHHIAGAKPNWCCYCGEHLYGRRIRVGVVEARRLVKLQEDE
jgi:hypothetical protein